MLFIKVFFLAIFTNYLLTQPLHSQEQDRHLPETILRIAILEKVPSFNLGSENDCEVVEMATGNKKFFSSKMIFLVSIAPKGILIGDQELRSPIRIIPKNEGSFLRVNGKRYRDSLLIKKNSKNKMTVINELGLDGYLYGILPQEVSPNWPIESLKAQAVVSRTFALKNLYRHNAEGFHLCSRVHCQVYGGLDGEKEETNRAVDETHNEVLTYQNELANTVFFSNCGGKTEDPLNAWETNASPPYLKSNRCRYCKNEPHYRWEIKLSQKEIVQSLRKKGYSCSSPVQSIAIAKYGRSGRAKYLRLKHAAGKLTIRASHFRLALGPETIRSTLFSEIKKMKNSFYFRGRGWGHGVGMCQEGAKGVAESETNYKKIVQFYYPGTSLETWQD